MSGLRIYPAKPLEHLQVRPQLADEPLRRKQQGAADPSFGIGVGLFRESAREPDVSIGFTLTIEGDLRLTSYRNYAQERLREAAREEARRKAEQEQRERLEARRRAEQARLAREKAEKEAARQRRWNEFVRKYGVQEMVQDSSLFANPFLYQGKTIAVTLRFERMMTASSAVFDGGGDAIFVVSSIPTGTYRSRRERRDVLTVRVIGMTDIKGQPMINAMQVPNLRFVGLHFCQDWNCGDILKK